MVHDLGDVDLTDLDTFADGFPHDIFRLHRDQAPVWWHEPTAHTPDGEGFWSVATYDEVLQVLRDPVTYSSETGGDRPYGGTIIQDLPVAGIVLNMMDDPRHARIRRLVTRGLTPAAVRDLEQELRGRMRRLVDSVDGECDFLVDVAAELPMQAICLLLGVPESDRHLLFDAVEHIFDIPDESDFLSMTPERQAAVGLMYEYGAALIREKRAVPCPDMLSTVIHATLPDADPPQLSDDELSAFFSLLFSAGAETTRNAIAGAMLAFLSWPEQLDLLRSGQASDGDRGGGDPALDDAVALEAQDGDRCMRARRRTHQSRTEGGRVGGLGQPGPETLRRAGRVPPAACAQSAPGLRPRRPLLPRRAPGPPRNPRGPRRDPSVRRLVHPRGPGAMDAQQPPHRYPPPPVAVAQGDHNITLSTPACRRRRTRGTD